MTDWLSKILRLQPARCSTTNLVAASWMTRALGHAIVTWYWSYLKWLQMELAALHWQPACREKKLGLTHSVTACISRRLAWSLAWHISPGRKGSPDS